MSAASPTFDPTTSNSTIGAISSRGSDSGLTPSELLDSPPTNLFGLDRALVSPIPRRASKKAKKTQDTSGLPGADSSASASLQQCLESRLRLRLEKAGSTLFNLTWSERVTPSGRRYLVRQVSVRRISVKDCTSWPTPNAGPQNDGDTTWEQRREDLKAQHKNGNGFGMTLGQASTLAHWQSPTARDWISESATDAFNLKRWGHTRGKPLSAVATLAGPGMVFSGGHTTRANDAEKRGIVAQDPRNGLVAQVNLTNWSTPLRGRDHDSDNTLGRYYPSKKQKDLEYEAWLAGSGEMEVGSGVAIRSTDQLNPAHSRWLMGCQEIWDRSRKTFSDWQKWQDFLNSHYSTPSTSVSQPCTATATL